MQTLTVTRKNTPAIFHGFYRRRVMKFRVTVTPDLRLKPQEIGVGEYAYGEHDRHYLVDLTTGTREDLHWIGGERPEIIVPLPEGKAVARFNSAYPASWEFYMTPKDAQNLQPVEIKEKHQHGNTLFLK